MKKIILSVLALPLFASAADVGQWFSPIGDSVSIRRTQSGKYHADIETAYRGSTCSFSEKMEEWEEGDLRYESPNCSLRVLQDGEDSLSVSVSGCRQYCGPRANLRITRAVKAE